MPWIFPSGGGGGGGTQGTEIGYDQITAPVTVSSVTEATGTTIITCAAHTFDGSAVLAEWFCPILNAAAVINAAVFVSLFEGATQIGRLTVAQGVTPAANVDTAGYGALRFTPTAASHTYSVTGFQSGGNGLVTCGLSGTGAYVPSFIRFTKV